MVVWDLVSFHSRHHTTGRRLTILVTVGPNSIPEWPTTMRKVYRTPAPFTARFATLKRSIVPPENEEKLTESWKNLLVALQSRTEEIKAAGSTVSVCTAK